MENNNYFIEKAKKYAFKQHDKVNQKYDNYLPYTYHLSLVVAVANKYIGLIPIQDRATVIAACYCHDILEDTHITYNDLKKELGEQVAEIVYAVTNEKGRNRKERANDKYYEGIRAIKYASFVKICDRIANVLYSCMFGSSMLDMHKKEYESFKNGVMGKDTTCLVMMTDLDYLLKTKNFGFEPIFHEVQV